MSSKSGKYAKTNYKVLERFAVASLIELKLETGRTHQIRVHLNHLKHPVIGDKDYNGNKNNYVGASGSLNNLSKYIISRANRQMLHAKDLKFIHPISNLEMHFTSELPEDMSVIIELLKSFQNND